MTADVIITKICLDVQSCDCFRQYDIEASFDFHLHLDAVSRVRDVRAILYLYQNSGHGWEKVYSEYMSYDSFKAVLKAFNLPDEVDTAERFSFSFTFEGPKDNSIKIWSEEASSPVFIGHGLISEGDLDPLPRIRLQECLYFVPRDLGPYMGRRANGLVDIHRRGCMHDILYLLKTYSNQGDGDYKRMDLIESITQQLEQACYAQIMDQERNLAAEQDVVLVREKLRENYILTHVGYRIGWTWIIEHDQIGPFLSNAGYEVLHSDHYNLIGYLVEGHFLLLMMRTNEAQFELKLPWQQVQQFLAQTLALSNSNRHAEERGRIFQ